VLNLAVRTVSTGFKGWYTEHPPCLRRFRLHLILKAFGAKSGCNPLDTTARWGKPRITTQIRHVNFNNNTTEINQSLSGMRAQRGRCSGPRLGHTDRCTPPQRKRNRLVYCFTSATAAFSSVSLQRLSCQQLPVRIMHRQLQGLCINVCHRCSKWSRNKYVDLVQRICPISQPKTEHRPIYQ